MQGCETGEEAYSLAILLRERIENLNQPVRATVFASDINGHALDVARTGRYPAPLLQSMKPERISRFFVKDAGTYLIDKNVREMCIFSAHSLIRDPPFSRVDLISCRNLLIYLSQASRAR